MLLLRTCTWYNMCLLCRGDGRDNFSQYAVEQVRYHSRRRCIRSPSTTANGNVLEPQQADCSHFCHGLFDQVHVKALRVHPVPGYHMDLSSKKALCYE